MIQLDYTFANARIGAMKAELIDGTEMKSLRESRDFEDAFSLLKGTMYGKDLAKLSSPSLVEIEGALARDLVKDCETIIDSVTGVPKIFFKQYAKKFEIAAIKALLILKNSGLKTKEHPLIPHGVMTKQMIEKLVEMETVEEVVEMLKFTEYYAVLHKALSGYKDAKTVYPFIMALDAHVYGRLGRIMEKIYGRDRTSLRQLVGTEIDAKNLLNILRLRDADEKEAWGWLIPYRYKLKDSDLRAAFNVKKLSELPHVIEPYNSVISNGVEEYEKTGSLLKLELEFKKYMLEMSRRAFGGDRFHIGVPIAYLNLKDNEIRNLMTILHAKNEKLTAPEIEELTIATARA